jgi:aspartokinase
MALPTEPVTFTPEQVAELNSQLSIMRHDVNNHVSLIMAAVELIRQKPQVAERMLNTVAEQPSKIAESIKKFSTEFSHAFGISRPLKDKNV